MLCTKSALRKMWVKDTLFSFNCRKKSIVKFPGSLDNSGSSLGPVGTSSEKAAIVSTNEADQSTAVQQEVRVLIWSHFNHQLFQ